MKPFQKYYLFLFTMLSFSMIATAQDRSPSFEKVIENIDRAGLDHLYQESVKKQQEKRAYMLKYANENNIPLLLEDPKTGRLSVLQEVTENGTLLYYTSYNIDAAISTRTNFLHTGGGLGLNLNGDGMLIHVWDSDKAVNPDHQEFDGVGGTNRVTVMDGTSNGFDDHAQHVTGTIVASGFNANAKGMAWQADAHTYDWTSDLTEATAAAANGMIISNHSYGYNTSLIPDEAFGKYDANSRNWDEIMHNAPHYLMVVAAGNDGSNNYNGTPLDGNANRDKMAGRSLSKNSLAVANAQDANINTDGSLNTVQINSGSSQGPADDYRIKPDITGNGTALFSSSVSAAGGDINDDYATFTGTSMATPNVSGSLLLLQEHYDKLHNTFMKAATLKGLALHTADDAGVTGPDPVFGWGLLNAKKAAETITKGSNSNDAIIQEMTLAEGQSITIPIQSNNVDDLKVSISWTDPEGIVRSGTNNTTPVLVNDLDIRLDKNGTTTFMPWKLTGVDANGKGDNAVDPYERIDVDNATGVYVLTISHKGILQGGEQDFSLVITGANSIENSFVTTWQIDTPDTSITIPTFGSGYNYNVKWGDGSFSDGRMGDATHTYTNAGTYNVAITGDFPRIYFNNTAIDKDKIVEVKHWGNLAWQSMENAFYGCSNLVISAGNSPDLSGVTNMNNAFNQIEGFSSNISGWEVNPITSMVGTFKDINTIDPKINGWDISNVTDMTDMFSGVTIPMLTYDEILIGWSARGMLQTGITFNGGNSQYCIASAQRQQLIDDHQWTITDGGTICNATDFITRWAVSSNNETITIPTVSTLTYNYSVNWGDGTTDINVTGNATHTYTTPGQYLVSISGTFPRIRFNNAGDKDKIVAIEQWGNNSWTNMREAFYGCSNLVIDAPDVPDLSDVTNLSFMFHSATSLVSGLENWDVRTIVNMSSMFEGASQFNGAIGNWNTRNAKNMSRMFFGATAFNQNIGNWNVAKATNMSFMFTFASNFNQDIGNWNVGKVTNMSLMLNNASSFDQNLGNWDISSVTNMSNMFFNSQLSTKNYDATLIGWNTLDTGETQIPTNVIFRAGESKYCVAAAQRQDLIDTFGWTILDGGSLGCGDSTDFITLWEVTTAGESITIPTTGSGYNYSVNWGDGQTDTGFTGNATHAYANPGTYAVSISGDFPRIYFNNATNRLKIKAIQNWGDIQWSTMERAFYGCSEMVLNALDAPDLSNVTHCGQMFQRCWILNSDLDHWDVSAITNMNQMFRNAFIFNGNVTNWNVSNVTNMAQMFWSAGEFNQDIGSWNVSQVTDMKSMLRVTAFNHDLSTWNVSNVTEMQAMFRNNTVFNQDLSTWNVAKVTQMQNMFNGATAFNQSLGAWNVDLVANMTGMLDNSGLSEANYDATLVGWSDNNLQSNVTLGASGLTYGCDGRTARETIISNYNWSITGDTDNCYFPFITTWDNTGPTADNQLVIPGVGTYDIYWEEVGNATNNGQISVSGTHTLQLPSNGIYRIELSGNLSQIQMSNSSDNAKLLSIEQWGEIAWTSMYEAFYGCTNMTYNATDAPDLSNVTECELMFSECSSFNGAIGNWDVGNITDMTEMFIDATSFNGDIGNWDTSNVTTLSGMFDGAVAFNQDIGSWNVSQVTNMGYMFSGCSAFNQDLSNWNVGNVTSMRSMFSGAASFNQDLGTWSTVKVTSMRNMFRNATNFNGNIGNWNTAMVTNMWYMFSGASAFNQNIGGWNVGEVTQMHHMFENAMAFNQDIGAWDVGKVTRMDAMFRGAVAFNQDIGSWDVSSVEDMELMFDGATLFNQDISGWPLLSLIDMRRMFQNAVAFNQDISSWSVSQVTDMGHTFSGATAFDQNLGAWDVSNVQFMEEMLDNTSLSIANYDNTLTGWSGQTLNANIQLGSLGLTYSCKGKMAREAIIANFNWTVNGDTEDCTPFITTWDNTGMNADNELIIPGLGDYIIQWEEVGNTSNNGTATATGIFTLALPSNGIYQITLYGALNQMKFGAGGDRAKLLTIEQWGNNVWESMEGAFFGCVNMIYNATDVPDLSQVSSFKNAFRDCSSFNGAIGNWDVSNVDIMLSAFRGASSFNQPLNDWDMSIVYDVRHMFQDATSFDQPVNNWDTSRFLGVFSMFRNATSFNQDLSSWDFSRMTDFGHTFSGATAFDQNLGNWYIPEAENMFGMLDNCGMSVANYDATLIGWAASNTRNDAYLGAEGLQYCISEEARNFLEIQRNWTINDDGLSPDCGASIAAKVYLQGAIMNPNTGEEMLMRDDLRVASHLPTTSPYADAATCDATVFDTTGNNAIIDWVWIELRDANNTATIIDGQSALLQRDGDIVTTDGQSAVWFQQYSSDYFVVINHRNHLGIMSANTYTLSNTATSIDFSDVTNPITHGSHAQTTAEMPTGILGLWAGNANGDNKIIFLNTGAESVDIKQRVLDVSAQESPFGASVFYKPQGYYQEDIDMNGEVIFLNAGNELLFIKDNILAHPNNAIFNSIFFTITEQLP